jgi:hypothetical protein
MGPRTGLDAVEKGKILSPCQESNPQPVAGWWGELNNGYIFMAWYLIKHWSEILLRPLTYLICF